MYNYSMESCLLHCVSGSLSDFVVVYFIEIFNTFVLSQLNFFHNLPNVFMLFRCIQLLAMSCVCLPTCM